jgi:hypothetical protein
LRKYESAIDTSCAFETNDLNLTTANFDSYGNVSFDPCECTLHAAANAANNDCSKKHVCFLQHMNMCEKMVTIRHQLMLIYSSRAFRFS